MNPSSIQTALLVHPHTPTRQMVRAYLKYLGIGTIHEAAEGWEAIAHMRESLIDVVLTGWHTPDLEGVALIRALRKQGRNRSVPVILLEDGLDQASIVAAVKSGALRRLRLPPDRDALKEVLENLTTPPPHEWAGK